MEPVIFVIGAEGFEFATAGHMFEVEEGVEGKARGVYHRTYISRSRYASYRQSNMSR